LDGSAGAAGFSSSCFFSWLKLRMSRNTEKATMRRLMMALKKTP
jgi:hypothetical protein